MSTKITHGCSGKIEVTARDIKGKREEEEERLKKKLKNDGDLILLVTD